MAFRIAITVNTPPRSVLRRSSHNQLLRPLLTSRSGSTPSPFQALGEISPGKNALLHRTTAGFTPLHLGHESFTAFCPLALVRSAFYPVPARRSAASIHASSPHSVTLMQLRFTSLAVTSSRWDFHPQEHAHAGRKKLTSPAAPRAAVVRVQAEFGLYRRRACRLVGISRSLADRAPKRFPGHERLSERLQALAAENRRFGYRRLHALLKREGFTAN